jgi:hypothetical protein
VEVIYIVSHSSNVNDEWIADKYVNYTFLEPLTSFSILSAYALYISNVNVLMVP